MSKEWSAPNPILGSKYDTLRLSSNPTAQKIVSLTTDIYNNAVIFNKSTNVQELDNSILDIQSKFNELIEIATPCSSISNTDKCNTPVCNFVAYIENIYLDLFLLLNSLPGFEDQEKKEYSFITFFMTYYFSNMVTSNPSNQDKYSLPKIVYRLCAGQTYRPSGLSPSLSSKYDILLARMQKTQAKTIVRQETNNSMNFLLYILLPSIVFIILVLLYIKHSRQAAIDDEVIKEAIASIKKK